MEKPLQAPATEVAKRFSQYRRAAQRAPVAITHHGQVTEFLISKTDHDEYQRLKAREPKAVWAWELAPDLAEAVASARMDPRHADLDSLMDD